MKAAIHPLYATELVYVTEATKQIASYRKAADTAELKIRCSCLHRRKNGDYALNANGKKDKNGHTIVPCTLCGKSVGISNISEADVLRALDTLDSVCDIAKLKANLNSTRDLKITKQIAVTQFKLLNHIPVMFKAITAKNNNGGRRTSS